MINLLFTSLIVILTEEHFTYRGKKLSMIVSGHLGSSFLQFLHFTDSTDMNDLDLDLDHKDHLKLWNTPSLITVY